ncbi:sensor histidine kinase [Arcobacter sp. YIC-310]|uniref:sensor histidine kinase n=1 Tax=Arcobacter sp. YIC-310 TaxID=3376632 RepID=UPI003C18045D
MKQEEIKKEIFKKTFFRLKYLKDKHIKNIKFYSSKNNFFLNVSDRSSNISNFNEKPELYKEVRKRRTMLHSYTFSANTIGFSFVYPIFDKKEYIGLIDITFSEQFISSSMMKNHDVLCNVIINNKVLPINFLKNNQEYTKSHQKGFIHNKNILNEIQRIAKKSISEIKPSLNTSILIYKQANDKNVKSMFLNRDDVIITTIPIFDAITNKQLAFVAVISQGHELNVLNKNYMLIKTLSIILIGLAFFIIYQQKQKRILEKANFEKIVQKDKQLLEQSKMAQMGEMLGNIAHQWRQPLSTISTVASGIKLNSELNMLKEEDISKGMTTIVSSTKYLSQTIDTFRDFIKEKKEKKEEVLQTRIDESIMIVAASLKNNHIELINNIDYSSDIKIFILGQELTQVLINILNNAKDAIVQREIKTKRYVKIELLETIKTIEIIIEDNARGISEENLPKVFDPYFTTKHKSKGTGLGLYMCKNIVEKHFEGELIAMNGKEGAIFKIVLPKKSC